MSKVFLNESEIVNSANGNLSYLARWIIQLENQKFNLRIALLNAQSDLNHLAIHKDDIDDCPVCAACAKIGSTLRDTQ